MPTPHERIDDLLASIYGSTEAPKLACAIQQSIRTFRARYPQHSTAPLPPAQRLSQRDAFLITYGDQIQTPGQAPLRTLHEFLHDHVADVLSGVHILPFYPWSSDDGFSVVDYAAVDPALGSWEDVEALGAEFRLMFDGVINHISASSRWFQGFLAGEAPYTGYFIEVDPDTDLSQVVRPRTLPLLTRVETAHGPAHVWTTFSADQIDLNFADLRLLLDIVDVLLLYVARGAQLIRLDAIAFLWKEIGTNCLHRPQTHALIQLFRAILDLAAPNLLLVTETNVPHAENISYFGDGANEAQMVYNFSLPPLTLHTFATGDASVLQHWAAALKTPSDQTTWFNFNASHDGIGLRPVEGILSPAEVSALCARTERHGGLVSYKANSDGSQSPYELNITYFDALNNPNSAESQKTQVDRFIASQAILTGLAGVPGIYAHSLLGSRNWREGAAQSGRNRTINRQKMERAVLERELADPAHLRHQVFQRYRRLLAARCRDQAFHPNGGQRVIAGDPAFFAFLRTAPDGRSRVLCAHNVTDRPQTLRVGRDELGGATGGVWQDLFGDTRVQSNRQGLELVLPAYGVRWLRAL